MIKCIKVKNIIKKYYIFISYYLLHLFSFKTPIKIYLIKYHFILSN